MPEPLRGKKKKLYKRIVIDNTPSELNMYNKGVDDSFTKFQSAVEFYKKYHNNYEQYIKDNPKHISLIKSQLWMNGHNYDNEDERYNDFNEWLFDYCFGDVVDD